MSFPVLNQSGNGSTSSSTPLNLPQGTAIHFNFVNSNCFQQFDTVRDDVGFVVKKTGADCITIQADRLFWVCSAALPVADPEVHFFSIDDELVCACFLLVNMFLASCSEHKLPNETTKTGLRAVLRGFRAAPSRPRREVLPRPPQQARPPAARPPKASHYK